MSDGRPPSQGSGWLPRVVSSQSLGVVSLLLGIVLSAINIYLFFDNSTKRELEKLKATIEQLSLQPGFDVTYYSVVTHNPLGIFIQGEDFGMTAQAHPLTQSKLLVDRQGKHFFLDTGGEQIPDGFVETTLQGQLPPDRPLSCNYFVVNFKYTGAVKLASVTFEFEMLSGKDMLPSLDTLQGAGEGPTEDELSGLKRTPVAVEVANVENGDAYFVPLTINCGTFNEEFQVHEEFSFRRIGMPSKIKFHDPISGDDESVDVRKMLFNAIINSAGVLERG